MSVNYNIPCLARVTAATVTTATFAKPFVPFYLIGSTVIFAATSALGVALVAIDWRPIYDMARKVADVLVILAAFYGLVIVNFLVLSRPAVSATHLVGILALHSLFMIFGFAAARALKAVLFVLLSAAAIYSIVIVHYAARFGDLMRDGYLHDVFGVGEPAVSITFHQNIGMMLGLAALAALGLGSSRIKRIIAIGALPLVLLFMFYIAARGALVALVCSLAFLVGASVWVRSKKLALLAVITIILAVTLASGLLYQRALQDKEVDPKASDAISRTIREIQDPRPGFRIQILARTWDRISNEPNRLLFGRGIGMFPVNEGFGAPDWLLRKTEGARHYPHNVHLEILYETGIVGLLLFSILAFLPIGLSLKRWHSFSPAEKAAVSLYVFNLVSSELSGAFAFSYDFQFFFALAVGIIARKRMNGVAVADMPPSGQARLLSAG
ncbi:O-antigen ligase family protein [Bradyrhizobium sediminis]|uniref:O-antigen ligase family protein n=1 Tax=Bradyrhizobium sediminis TaxID=2840469 RepID=A0A975P0Y1_9BRAD|nr:O-antigen ligase family protein [Bradyrhizobium sediminis]QWG25082.1 O-antigen ligase family protein [Bradyrhizobium sediminis]